MIRYTALAALMSLALAAPSVAAEPIEGRWRTETGSTAEIAPCGGAYCIKLISGEHQGKEIGRLTGSGGNYEGKVTDPKNDKTYSGKAAVDGGKLDLSGCVLGGLICKTQVWTRL